VTAASYDAIVIGTSQSGPYATSRLAAAGMKVAVIERKVFGENPRSSSARSSAKTCVNTGCIPTKTQPDGPARGRFSRASARPPLS
jgi:pyruvate/2-oxoglutarate dehydrogenase complex dihydrolipoamide dehydrogenase (E3) component